MSVEIYEHGPRPEQVRAAFLAAAERQMKAAMAQVDGEIKRRAPFRTGYLRRSITFLVKREGSVIRGFVGTTTRYAPFLEYGTGLYGPRNRRITPTKAQALRFPAGGSASLFSGGRRVGGSAGPGFRLSGQRRSGSAGAGAEYVFARSVRGVRPIRFFADGVEISRGRVQTLLRAIPTEARQLLAAGGAA